jgi:hypothetical protein
LPAFFSLKKSSGFCPFSMSTIRSLFLASSPVSFSFIAQGTEMTMLMIPIAIPPTTAMPPMMRPPRSSPFVIHRFFGKIIPIGHFRKRCGNRPDKKNQGRPVPGRPMRKVSKLRGSKTG